MAKISNIYYTASDAPGLAGFYQKVFQVEERFADGDRWVQLDAGGVGLAIASEAESAVLSGAGGVVTFRVDHLESAMATVLDASGTILTDIRDMGDHGRTVACRDPMGNVFQLLQR